MKINRQLFKRVSVFWKQFLLMLCFLIFMIIAQIVMYSHSYKALVNENVATVTATLERNCNRFESALISTAAIPGAIEDGKYYNYIRVQRTGKLSEEYISALANVQKSLSKQFFLCAESAECVLYFSNCNSICTRNRVYPDAKECFVKYIKYREISPDAVMNILSDSKADPWIREQEVSIGNRSGKYLSYISKEFRNGIPVLTLYSSETVQNFFDAATLPKGSRIEIIDKQGQLLFLWSGGQKENSSEETLFERKIERLSATVRISIPEAYYYDLLKSTRMTSYFITCFAFISGLMLCYIFSKVTVRPIRQLLETHDGGRGSYEFKNEIENIDFLMRTSEREAEKTNHFILFRIMDDIFEGRAVSAEDEVYFETYGHCHGPYQLMIIKASNQALLLFSETLAKHKEHILTIALNEEETGVIIPDCSSNKEKTDLLIVQFNELLHDGEQVTIGISAPFDSLSQSFIALRQARIACSQPNSVTVYRNDMTVPSKYAWSQNERLYHIIQANNEEKAIELIQEISVQANPVESQMIFSSLAYILCCSADEVGVSVDKIQLPPYNQNLSLKEQILSLIIPVRELFRIIREKKIAERAGRYDILIEYIDSNYTDQSISLGSVSEYFHANSKWINTAVETSKGIGFNAYLLSLRMNKAAALLSDSNFSISDVAKMCGYPAESTFYRLFKENFGITPVQYRKKYQTFS